MKWTKNPPTKAGMYYWTRVDPNNNKHQTDLVEVRAAGKGEFVVVFAEDAHKWDVHTFQDSAWCGPLEAPHIPREIQKHIGLSVGQIGWCRELPVDEGTYLTCNELLEIKLATVLEHGEVFFWGTKDLKTIRLDAIKERILWFGPVPDKSVEDIRWLRGEVR